MALSYWEKRKAREAYEMYRYVEEKALDLSAIYAEASSEISEEARRVFRKFQVKNGLSEREATRLLNTVLDPEKMSEIMTALRRDSKNMDLIAELESQAYAARFDRLNKLQKSVDSITSAIAVTSMPIMTNVLKDVANYAYYHEIFSMQQRANAGFLFNPMTPEKIAEILNRNWSGEYFSRRIWNNTEELSKAVKREVIKGMLMGKSAFKMSQAIDEKFHQGASNARRLMRTESNYVANQVTKESYNEAGVDRYIYVAVLDLRTSEICRSMDGKRYLVKNATPGKNYPPMHPWCRSTTIAWMPEELLKELKRSAIDPNTGKRIKVPADMTYNEWYNKYVSGLRAGGTEITSESHKPPKMVGTIDIKDVDSVKRVLSDYEDTIASSDIENAIVITTNGEIYHCYGEKNGVWPDADLGNKLRGAYVTHNHPVGSDNEYSFSKLDVNLFIDYELEELRGVDEKYKYILSRADKTVDDPPTVVEAMRRSGENQRHMEVIRVADEIGAGYRRYER